MNLNPLKLFSRWSGQQEEKVSSAGTVISAWGKNEVVWTPRNYEKLTRESYIQNAVGFRCVKMISLCATVPDWVLMRNGEVVDDHELLDLLKRPSPTCGGKFFFETLYSYLLLSGNSYVERVGPNTGEVPRELYVQRPDRMKVVAGKFGIPKAYVYENQGQKRQWDVNQLTGESDILHIKEFHPTNDWYGMSRVDPAAKSVDTHNAASEHNAALLQNGARPSGAMIFEPVDMPGGMGKQSAPEPVLEKAMEELNKRHTNPRNAGKPMVLSGKVKWEEMSISPKDMDFNEGKLDSAREICTAWGVPHILVVKGQSTYNNLAEAKLELYEDTVLPLIENVTSELNNWLTPLWGEDFELVPDLDSIPALEPRRQKKRETISGLLKDGVIDADESREELGYGERDKDTVKAVDAQVLTALVGAVETVGVKPLFRYMKSVGLVGPEATEESVLSDALALIEDDDEDDQDELVGDRDPAEEEEEDDAQAA